MTRRYERYDIQGRFLGIPYDFRIPTCAKIVRRLYLPGGPIFAPKIFGWGWGVNFANPAGRWIFAVLVVVLLGMAVVG